MTYCVCVLEPAAVLPKCAAARTASAPIWSIDGMLSKPAVTGVASDGSNHTPLSSAPLGLPTCGAVVGQLTSPAATPSQYCCETVVQSSPVPYRPFRKFCK